MDVLNLHTAASYVNNLLLARGLLRNGNPVEFAHLAAYQPKEDPANRQGTAAPLIVADIINLVHDLILKRDRDTEHHDTLAASVRGLRTDSARQQTDIERLKTRNADLRRQLAISESTQRAAEATAKQAEASVRALREDVTKSKKTVDHVRTSCANDLRKRDIQISKLRSQLESRQQQRGTNRNTGGGLIVTITPGKTGMGNAIEEEGSLPNVADEQYSLRQETTEFLTRLSQSLSDENDQLISLIRNTLSTLKTLQGLPHNQPNKILHQSSRPGSSTGVLSLSDSSEMVHVSEVSCEALSEDLQGVLGSLSDLLTNPSFAPIEEVHVREEEIHRLKEGWEKMEGRWHEAMSMMQSWRKRLMQGGDTVRLDELKKGLRLGEGLDSPSRQLLGISSQGEQATEEVEEEDISCEEEENQEPDVEDLPEFELNDVTSVDKPLFDVSTERDTKPLFEPEEDTSNHHGNDEHDERDEREKGVLHETNGNATNQQQSLDNRLADLRLSGSENSSPLPVRPHSKAAESTSSRTSSSTGKTSSISQKHGQSRASRIPSTRLPARKVPVAKTRTAPPHRQSPAPERSLSVGEKLQIAERQARRMSSSPLNLNGEAHRSGSESPLESKVDKIESIQAPAMDGAADGQTSRLGSLRREGVGKSPVKRTRIVGRPRRRKSTLSPEELEALMLGR